MKKNKLVLLILLITISLMIGCTTNTNDNGPGPEGNIDNTQRPELIISTEIPDTFPEEIVPLYDIQEVEGVITVGNDYHQIYYYSNTDKDELFTRYQGFFDNTDIDQYSNEFAYEFSGNVEGNIIKMHILSSNQEAFETNVIIFIYPEDMFTGNNL